MKTLIIYKSIHRGNTEKAAKKIGEVLGAELKKPEDVKAGDLAGYDLIGFGSGLYGGIFHKAIKNFVAGLPDMADKKAFVFSTHSNKQKGWNKEMIESLAKKSFNIVGDFECQGVFSLWLFKIGKGHPNEEELIAAAAFAEGLKEKAPIKD